MNSKKRKMYVPPTVEVVQLKMRNQLLAGSGGKGGLQNYTKHDYDPKDDE
jgi:hypothetical protein